MIFDFISGEASTQEGGEKFAKWLAEDTDLTQKEKKSVVEKIQGLLCKTAGRDEHYSAPGV